MKKETIRAIHNSINHYNCIALGLHLSIDSEYCNLCKLFKHCSDCVIFKVTEKLYCGNTPWVRIYIYNNESKLLIDVDLKVWDYVEEEIEFLISLLPESEQLKYQYEYKVQPNFYQKPFKFIRNFFFTGVLNKILRILQWQV